MPRLSSPDPQIEALLASNVHLQLMLQAFIDEGKYTTRRILPGFWQKFLDSPHGRHWHDAKVEKEPVLESVPPIIDVLCEQCGRMFPTNTHAIRCRLCIGADKRTVSTPAPPQDDLFDLLARGLQDRIKPQGVPLDARKVNDLIEQRLATFALTSHHTLIIKKGDKIERELALDLPLPKWFDRVYKQALCRVHTLLVGPRGCGKTVTGELLAKALNLPLYTVSLSAGVSEGVLQGWLHPSKAGLLFEYNRSSFVRAYEEG